MSSVPSSVLGSVGVEQLLSRHRAVVPIASVQGTLALDLSRQPLPTLDPPGGEVVALEQPLRRGVEAWTRRYLQAVVEIVAGDRPASQLVRWTRPDVHADLRRRALLVARAGGWSPGQGRPRHAVRPQVASIHLSFVTREICEVSARVRHGERSRAVAARFEVLQGRLQCTALEFA